MAIDGFIAAHSTGEGSAQHITVDAYSYSAFRLANQKSFGAAVIPTYEFGKAKTIVGIGADFLSSWLVTNEYVNGYTKNRKAESDMSRHFQFESIMTVTGGAADVRVAIKGSEEGLVALALYNHIAQKASKSPAGTVSQDLMAKTKKARQMTAQSVISSHTVALRPVRCVSSFSAPDALAMKAMANAVAPFNSVLSRLFICGPF